MKRLLLLFAMVALVALNQCYKHHVDTDAPEVEAVSFSQLEREAESLRIGMICKLQEAERKSRAYRPDAAQMKNRPVLKEPPIYRVSATDPVHGYYVPE